MSISCKARSSFGTMFAPKNAAIVAAENTPFQGLMLPIALKRTADFVLICFSMVITFHVFSLLFLERYIVNYLRSPGAQLRNPLDSFCLIIGYTISNLSPISEPQGSSHESMGIWSVIGSHCSTYNFILGIII